MIMSYNRITALTYTIISAIVKDNTDIQFLKYGSRIYNYLSYANVQSQKDSSRLRNNLNYNIK